MNLKNKNELEFEKVSVSVGNELEKCEMRSVKSNVNTQEICSSNVVKNDEVLIDPKQRHLCPKYVKSTGPDIAHSDCKIGVEPEPADFGGIEGKDLELLFYEPPPPQSDKASKQITFDKFCNLNPYNIANKALGAIPKSKKSARRPKLELKNTIQSNTISNYIPKEAEKPNKNLICNVQRSLILNKDTSNTDHSVENTDHLNKHWSGFPNLELKLCPPLDHSKSNKNSGIDKLQDVQNSKEKIPGENSEIPTQELDKLVINSQINSLANPRPVKFKYERFSDIKASYLGLDVVGLPNPENSSVNSGLKSRRNRRKVGVKTLKKEEESTGNHQSSIRKYFPRIDSSAGPNGKRKIKDAEELSNKKFRVG